MLCNLKKIIPKACSCMEGIFIMTGKSPLKYENSLNHAPPHLTRIIFSKQYTIKALPYKEMYGSQVINPPAGAQGPPVQVTSRKTKTWALGTSIYLY
jgi:hypothetical protein